jgi:hypothetical protein
VEIISKARMTVTMGVRRLLIVGCGSALAAGAVGLSPAAAADRCAPGFVANPYTAQCLTPVSTPVINGQPCIASNIGLCSSFLQNQQPPRGPRPVG